MYSTSSRLLRLRLDVARRSISLARLIQIKVNQSNCESDSLLSGVAEQGFVQRRSADREC